MRKCNIIAGGIYSPAEKMHGNLIGFEVVDILSKNKSRFASLDNGGKKREKFNVDSVAFESIAIPALEGHRKYDIVVIDEIGWMELKSKNFDNVLGVIFRSEIPVLACINEDMIDRFRPFGETFELTGDNHELAFLKLKERIVSLLGCPIIRKKQILLPSTEKKQTLIETPKQVLLAPPKPVIIKEKEFYDDVRDFFGI